MGGVCVCVKFEFGAALAVLSALEKSIPVYHVKLALYRNQQPYWSRHIKLNFSIIHM